MQQIFKPYQLKTVYNVQQADEINWEDEEEDAMILAEQPFETAMSEGFGDFLSHLSTKFIARRSDIIVSSTLSITLTPIDEKDDHRPTTFANIDAQGIQDYIKLKAECRALNVQTNNIKMKWKKDNHHHTRSVSLLEMESSIQHVDKSSIDKDDSSIDSMFMDAQKQDDEPSLRRFISKNN